MASDVAMIAAVGRLPSSAVGTAPTNLTLIQEAPML